MSATNQKQFYQELDSCSNIPNEAPDAQKTSEFWNNIWSIPGNFNEKASWLPKVKERLSEIAKQEDIRISVENVKMAMRKIANWKTPGSDCAQDYWFKRFSRWHSRLTEHLQTCIVVGDVPTWMTKGKKIIDPEGFREWKCCKQLLSYRMPTTYVEGTD